MSAAIEPSAAPVPDHVPAATEWRATRHDLWVGRADGRHAGVIQRGRRYAATDASGDARGSFRSLEQAMTALADVPANCEADLPEARAWDSLTLVLTVVVAAAVLLATYALVML